MRKLNASGWIYRYPLQSASGFPLLFPIKTTTKKKNCGTDRVQNIVQFSTAFFSFFNCSF